MHFGSVLRRVRTLGAIAFFLAGAWLTLLSLIVGHWLSAVAWLLTGVLAAAATSLPELFEDWNPPGVWKAGAAIATGLFVFAILFEHPAFDRDRQKAHIEAFDGFGRMMLCVPQSAEINAIMNEGIKACLLQSHADMVDAIGQFQAAQYFGPRLSIIDGVRSASMKPEGDWCAEAYLAARPLCSWVFSGMSKESVASLEKGHQEQSRD